MGSRAKTHKLGIVSLAAASAFCIACDSQTPGVTPKAATVSKTTTVSNVATSRWLHPHALRKPRIVAKGKIFSTHETTLQASFPMPLLADEVSDRGESLSGTEAAPQLAAPQLDNSPAGDVRRAPIRLPATPVSASELPKLASASGLQPLPARESSPLTDPLETYSPAANASHADASGANDQGEEVDRSIVRFRPRLSNSALRGKRKNKGSDPEVWGRDVRGNKDAESMNQDVRLSPFQQTPEPGHVYDKEDTYGNTTDLRANRPSFTHIHQAVGEQRASLPWLDQPLRSPQMQAVAQRAHVFTSSGYILAERGAFFAARQEFMRALRIITRSLDASLGTTSHDGALAAGVKALDEADDFRRAMVSRDVDMEVIVSAHRTPILKGRSLKDVSPMQAVQNYYSYAQEQLGVAGGREPIASIALHGLAKLQPHLVTDQEIFWDENSGKAMVYDKAALLVDRGNFMAANDLGVQLAQHGYLSEASTLLDQAALQHPNPTTWRNLASVYQRLGRPDLSRLANIRAQQQAQLEKTQGHPANGVHWVSPEQFANTVRHSSSTFQSRTEKGATEKRVTRKKVASDPTGKTSRSRTSFWPFAKRSTSMEK